MQDNSLPFSGYWAQGGHCALPATSQAAGMAVESTAGRERLHESVGSAAGGIAGDCDRKRTRDLWEVRGGEGQSWTGGGYARGNGAAGGGHGRGSNLTASQEEFISGDAVRGAGLMPPMSGSTHAPPAAVVERQDSWQKSAEQQDSWCKKDLWGSETSPPRDYTLDSWQGQALGSWHETSTSRPWTSDSRPHSGIWIPSQMESPSMGLGAYQEGEGQEGEGTFSGGGGLHSYTEHPVGCSRDSRHLVSAAAARPLEHAEQYGSASSGRDFHVSPGAVSGAPNGVLRQQAGIRACAKDGSAPHDLQSASAASASASSSGRRARSSALRSSPISRRVHNNDRPPYDAPSSGKLESSIGGVGGSASSASVAGSRSSPSQQSARRRKKVEEAPAKTVADSKGQTKNKNCHFCEHAPKRSAFFACTNPECEQTFCENCCARHLEEPTYFTCQYDATASNWHCPICTRKCCCVQTSCTRRHLHCKRYRRKLKARGIRPSHA